MKTLLITGATGGLGQVLAQGFSKDPCRIGLHTLHNKAAGEALCEKLKSDDCETALFQADLRDSKSIRELFDNLFKRWGRLDLLINNAGTTKDGLFHRLDASDWDEVIAVNLSGPLYCMRAAAEIMRQNGGGQIINIGSLAGKTGRIGQAAYTASKRGLIALTQSAAREWGVDNIRVNAVCPGYLPTPMTAQLAVADTERLIAENQLRRPSTLEEITAFIQHLSTMQHVSGQVFNLDSRIA